MSDSVFVLAVTLILLTAALLWVPLLHLCRRLHRRFFQRILPVLGMGLLLTLPGAALGQLVAVNGIATAAGNGSAGYTGDGGLATSAKLNLPSGVACDSSGNLYIADTSNNVIRKVAVGTGIITTFAGNGTAAFAGDGGAATSAALNDPTDVAVDSSGNLYIADLGNARVRLVSASSGIISTVAGNGVYNYSGDGGQAKSASLREPFSVAVTASGDVYIADQKSYVVRKVSAGTGIITTVAGNGTLGFSGDGSAATSAELGNQVRVRTDTLGNLYLADPYNARIRKVTASSGIINTVVGNGTSGYTGDGGPATSAEITQAVGLALDSANNLYIADTINQAVRVVNGGSGIISTIAGNGTAGSTGDGGPALHAELRLPVGLAVDTTGNVYVAELQDNVVRTISPLTFPPTAVASTAARQYYYLQTTANETITSFTAPTSLGNKQEYTIGAVTGCVVDGKTVNPAGSICAVPVTFSPAYPGQRPIPLQAVTSTGNMNFPMNGLASAPLAALTPGIGTTIAGTGTSGNTGDGGLATSAKIGSPFLATDGVGNIYVADSSFQVVRRVDALTGVITKVAGTGVMGYSGDGGPALQATFGDVQAVTVDSSGNLYIADSVACVVRKITAATGIITTFAGNGTTGHSGIGGLAVNAQLCPNSLTVDAAGNLYIVDQGNSSGTAGDWVLKVTASTGILSVVAGTGSAGYSGDGGPATAAALKVPSGVALDSANNVYISDSHNNVLRKVNAMTGIITTIAGNGTYGFLGDGGPATSAEMEFPRAITLDSAGDIYFGDCCTYTVRKIDAATGIIRTVAGGGTSLTDGVPATTQGYSYVNAVALDATGNLYIGDFDARIHKVNVATTTLTFPTSTAVGSLDTTDDPQTALFSNIGNAPLNGFSGNGTITSSWLIDAASTCFPFSPVAAGTSCTIPVDFKPTVAGTPVTGTLTLLDTSLNAQPATQTITLTGNANATVAPAPQAALTPLSVTFGNVTVGSTSGSQTITLTNGGNAALSITSFSIVTISGAPATNFNVVSTTCGSSLAAGNFCTFLVNFTPPGVVTNLCSATRRGRL